MLVPEGLTTKGAATRERIVEAAADLFHAQGINATSVGDILRASGTGKSQFYQHFESRGALLQEVLKRQRSAVAEYRPDGIRSWTELRRFMDEHVEAQARARFQRGCPVGTAAYALQSHQTEARRVLRGTFTGMRKAIAAFLQQERAHQRLSASAQPAQLADFVVAAVQGGLLLGIVDASSKPARAAVDEAYRHLLSYRRK